MSVEKLIADRIADPRQNKGNISRPIVKIGIIGIAIGIAVMLLTVSIVRGFKREIARKITGLTTDIAVSNINVNASNEPEPIRISDDSLKILKSLPFVKSVQSSAFKNGLLKTSHENEGILLKGVGKDYDFTFINKHLVEGKLPNLDTKDASKDILVSEALATKMDLKLGEKIMVYFIAGHEVYDSLVGDKVTKSEQRSRKLTICGIFKTDFADFDEKLSIVDIRQVQRINFWDSSMVGNYEIKLKNFKELDQNLVSVQDFLGYDYNVNSVREIYYNIFMWLDKLDINGIIVVVLMILVATINMITALLILILERATMVGLLKALGMTNVNVRRIFLIISLKLVGRGLLWGNIFGIGLCLIQYFFKIARLNSDTYYVDYVAIELNWGYYLLLNIGAFAVCSLMLLLPTIIISKMTPLKTLKFD